MPSGKIGYNLYFYWAKFWGWPCQNDAKCQTTLFSKADWV